MKPFKAIIAAGLLAQLVMAESVVLQQGTDGYTGAVDTELITNKDTGMEADVNKSEEMFITVRSDEYC